MRKLLRAKGMCTKIMPKYLFQMLKDLSITFLYILFLLYKRSCPGYGSNGYTLDQYQEQYTSDAYQNGGIQPTQMTEPNVQQQYNYQSQVCTTYIYIHLLLIGKDNQF